MKVKLSKFERVAGLFVIACFAAFTFVVTSIAIKRGWFEEQVPLQTQFAAGDGLYPGMPVQISGLHAGAVDDVQLNKDNLVEVKFHVARKFFEKIKSDSKVSAARPFVIGDKVLDISLGSPENKRVAVNAVIPSTESIDLIDVFAGRRVSQMLLSLTTMGENLRLVVEAFGDSKRTRALIKTLDQVAPLVTEVRQMAHEISGVGRDLNEQHRLRETLEQVRRVSEDLAAMTPEILKVMKDNPDAAKNAAQVIKNMAVLTEAMSAIVPALAAVAPDLPRAGRRAVEAMDEAVITLKAMQKSWILSGKVEDVRAEEARKAPPFLIPLREPASPEKTSGGAP